MLEFFPFSFSFSFVGKVLQETLKQALPSLICAYNTNDHGPAGGALKTGIELLQNHLPLLPTIKN